MSRNAVRAWTLVSSVAVIGLTLALAATASAEWPVYGHDLANSRDAGSDGPAASRLGSLQRAWTFDSQKGDFTGTPVVAAGTLVAGTNLGTVYALDAVTGKQRWSHDFGQQINGSAAIDPEAPGGATVFVPIAQVGSPRLVGLSLATGAVRFDTVLTRQDGADVFGSPVYSDGTIYIGTSGPNNDESHARGSLVALNEATGSIRWQTFTVPPGYDGGAVWSTPALDATGERLYVGTGNAYHDPVADTTDSVLALDASNGQILGHYQSVAGDIWELNNPTAGPDYDFGAAPNLITGADGAPLVGEGSKSGDYWALDPQTMTPVWHTSIGPGSSVGGSLGSTAYDGTRIYGTDTIDAGVWALGRDGVQAWSSNDGGTVDFNPATIANGVLYTTGPSSFLTARDPATGAVLTKLPLDGPTFGGVSAVGGALYVATGTGPPPQPDPAFDTSQFDGNGSIIAFGDTSRSGAAAPAPAHRNAAPRARHHRRAHRSRSRHRRRTHRAKSAHESRDQSPPPAKAGTFQGTCQFAGTVYFQPALTNNPQDVNQRISAPGTCSGTFTDPGGQQHQLSDTPSTFAETSLATDSSCLDGTALGTGSLTFGDVGKVDFIFHETRGVAFPLLTLDGAKSGSAAGNATPSPSGDPVAAVEACNGAGLQSFDIQGQMATTPEISG